MRPSGTECGTPPFTRGPQPERTARHVSSGGRPGPPGVCEQHSHTPLQRPGRGESSPLIYGHGGHASAVRARSHAFCYGEEPGTRCFRLRGEEEGDVRSEGARRAIHRPSPPPRRSARLIRPTSRGVSRGLSASIQRSAFPLRHKAGRKSTTGDWLPADKVQRPASRRELASLAGSGPERCCAP